MITRLARLDEDASRHDFWQDNEKAQTTLRERSQIKGKIDTLASLEKEISDTNEILELARTEEDEEIASDIAKALERIGQRIATIETEKMLGGQTDRNNAIVQISPGAGGTESQDWAEMLLRMYLRWSERRGFTAEMMDLQPADEAGIKSATFRVAGEYAYGYLKGERGIHRLVRISPFDAAKRRHTSFAALDVVPEVDDDIEIDIRDEDLRIETFRAGGKGGQHVNKTDSAVRMTHIPSGIIVQCQNERSQHKNKSQALKVLRSRLYEKELEERRKADEAHHALKKEIAWGSQIRSYVLAPYRLVKDVRTGVETGNVDRVLDGEIDEFIIAYLRGQALAPAGGNQA